MLEKDIRRLFGLILCFFFIASGTGLAASFSYNFNSLAGNDVYPYANLNGQDGWTSQGFPPALIMGVTNTTGFDGTQALWFIDVGAGYGADASHLRTPSFAIPAISGSTTRIVLQGDFHSAAWGNLLEFAYDADNDGMIRQTNPAEIGPGLDIGAVPGVRIVSANATLASVTLASLGVNPGDWVRLRLEIDPAGSGLGSVYYQNLTTGAPGLIPAPGLQNINMGFNWSSSAVSNPSLWDSVYIHMEGAVNGFDNMVLQADAPVQSVPTMTEWGMIVLMILLGLSSVYYLRRQRRA